MFNEKSSMRLLTVSRDRETDCSFEAALSPHMSLAMSMAASFSSLSQIVWVSFLYRCAARQYTMPAWLAWRLKALDSFLSSFCFVSIPFLGAGKRWDSFSNVAGASFPNVSSIYFSSEIRWMTQYTLRLFSTMIFDRSESQGQKFLLVWILTHS